MGTHRPALRRREAAALPAGRPGRRPQRAAAGRAHQRSGYPDLTILEDYLETFPGAVIAVSHDRYFLDKTANRLLEVGPEGVVTEYVGNYTDYLAARQERDKEKEKARKTAPEKKEERPTGQKKLRFSYKEQREFETIDDDIAALEGEIAAVKAEAEAKASDYVALQELQAKQEALEAALEEKMDRWVYLNDLAERIANQ